MRLFNYCDARGIGILEDCRLKVTSPSEFNDPFDCMPWCDVNSIQSRNALRAMIRKGSTFFLSTHDPSTGSRTERRIRRRKAEQIEEKVLNSGLLDKTKSESINRFSVLCLSAEQDNYLMWAHYADKHRGMLLEFNLDSVFPLGSCGDGVMTRHLFQIEYSHIRPALDFAHPEKPALLTKGMEWKYEHEWRVMFHHDQVAEIEFEGKQMLFIDILPQYIRKVFLGCNAGDTEVQRVRELLSDPRFAHVELFRKRLHPREFHQENERLN